MKVMMAMFLAIQVGTGFGIASADGEAVGSTALSIAVSVEADPGDQLVLHGLDPGGDQRTVAMIEAAPGTYRTVFETRPVDLVIVFENLDTGLQSEPHRLSELGVPGELVGAVPLPPGEPEAPEDRSLLWLGVALGLASLSALAFWVLGGESRRQGDAETDPVTQVPDA
jgi:hypothetical protein